MAGHKPSLRDQAYDQIKRRIIDCIYAPGSVINEEQLQNEFSVSRTPIREALTLLAHEGFVQIMPKKGIRIARLTLNDVRHVFEVRMLLEPYILRQYGPAMGEQRLRELKQRHLALMDAGTTPPTTAFLDTVNALDYELHSTLTGAANNPYLSDLRGIVLAQNSRLRVLTGQKLKRRYQQTLSEHLAILDALLEGDTERAAACMEEHLKESERAAFIAIAASGDGGR